MPLRKKGQGRAIHVSDFIVEETGHLCLSEVQCKENAALPPDQKLECTDAREIMYPGKNYEGWWNMEKLVAQVCYPQVDQTKYSLGTYIGTAHDCNQRTDVPRRHPRVLF